MATKPIVTACAMVLALGGLSAGAVFPGTAVAKDKAKKDDPGRKVCKNIVKAGTRLSTRDCRTQQQWDEAMDKTQEGVLSHQMGPGTTTASPTFTGLPPN